ncbi:hypothetical protein [Bifidobacterium sp. SO4]|uniref:hypothetical protein n=1 Tax=Bifidobacterium sp. SO4 TaxID=2809030 RepID=UPI001BDD3AA5|nr:hypothetical protein [Bifidobacterium sp. SO4]MBT1171755.1 hypothetical protein [Bifidobacterium sp. SO4]
MCIYLEWTTDIGVDSYDVLDHNHLESMTREDRRHATERLQSFIDAVIGADTDIDRLNGRTMISAFEPDEPEQTKHDWCESFVPASGDDAEWRMDDLLALLDGLARIGRQGVTNIDFHAGTCVLPDGSRVRVASWEQMTEPVNDHLAALEAATTCATGFLTIQSSGHTLPLTAGWMRDLKRGLTVALDVVRISRMSRRMTAV